MSDCKGCKYRTWIARSDNAPIGSGYGCDLSGGHAIARCADYDQSSVTVVKIDFNHKRVQQHTEIKYNKKASSNV